MQSTDLLNLIRDYIACSKYFCATLKEFYGIHNESLLRARRKNLVPKEGQLPDGVYFNFHGIGCYFEFETGAIDVDFGPDDRFDGFDFERLVNFIKMSKLPKYRGISDFTDLEMQYKKAIEQKIIICPNFHPSTSLCYLNINSW